MLQLYLRGNNGTDESSSGGLLSRTEAEFNGRASSWAEFTELT